MGESGKMPLLRAHFVRRAPDAFNSYVRILVLFLSLFGVNNRGILGRLKCH
jgi:hypothetical protein